MELPGSSYLYTIFTGSITYAGFAALIVIFRQIIGGRVSSYDVFVVRVVLMRSFIVASAMLPPALALFDLSHPVIWRISSLFAAFLLGLFTLTYHARRRAITGLPNSAWFLIAAGWQSLIAIFLLMMALGIFVEPTAGPFVVSITALLLLAAISYLVALDVLLRGHVEKKSRR